MEVSANEARTPRSARERPSCPLGRKLLYLFFNFVCVPAFFLSNVAAAHTATGTNAVHLSHPTFKRTKSVVNERDLSDPSVEAELRALIKDPNGPLDFVFEASVPSFSTALFDTRPLVPVPHLDPVVAAANYTCDVIADLAMMANENHKRFSIFRERDSSFWSMPSMVKVAGQKDALTVLVDTCHAARGRDKMNTNENEHMKILTNDLSLRDMHVRCGGPDRCRAHRPPKGRHVETLSAYWALTLRSKVLAPPPTLYDGSSWAATMNLTVLPKDRHRDLGAPVKEVEFARQHKRRRSVAAAMASGVQTKRRAFDPTFEVELEPGEAVRHACACPFPFDDAVGVDASMKAAI